MRSDSLLEPGAFLPRDKATQLLIAAGAVKGKSALADLAARGAGPRYRIVRGRALYRREDLEAWLAENASAEAP